MTYGGIVIGGGKEFVEVVDDERRAAVEERVDSCTAIDTDDYREVACLSGSDSRRGVFDHDSACRLNAKAFGTQPISVRRRLASQTLGGSDDAIDNHIESVTQASGSEHGHGVLR